MSFNENTYGFNDHKPNSMIFSGGKMQGKIQELSFDNIYAIKSNLHMKDTVKLHSKCNINGIMLSYNLKGMSKHKSLVNNYQANQTEQSSQMILINQEYTQGIVKKGDLHKINLIIKKDFIANNLPNGKIKDTIFTELEKENTQKLLNTKKMDAQKLLLLNNLFSSSFSGKLNNILIQSKVLEIIFMEFTDLFVSKGILKDTKLIKLDKQDIEAIKKAKEILFQNLHDTPSISKLAKQVALNEFKLKTGFKKIFGTTPYNLLLEYRLDLAKELLLQSDMNVNEISEYIGYKHTQNFSTMFTKHFGFRPIDLMKKRKYYY